jgi:DNA-binding MarR family transcriptional regulator
MASSIKSDDQRVVLSGQDAREIARLLRLLESPESAKNVSQLLEVTEQDNSPSALLPRGQLLARARAVLSERRRRAQFFSSGLFGEPAWDMLLGLYIMNGKPLQFGKLVNLVGAPQTTAIRWLKHLEDEGLVARRSDPDDARLVRMELLERALDLLDAYFSSMPESLAALG